MSTKTRYIEINLSKLSHPVIECHLTLIVFPKTGYGEKIICFRDKKCYGEKDIKGGNHFRSWPLYIVSQQTKN